VDHTLFCWLLIQPTNIIFLSHQTSTSHQYFSLTTNQHKPPSAASSQQNRKVSIGKSTSLQKLSTALQDEAGSQGPRVQVQET